MLNNSETDGNKSAQYKVKSRHFKWLLLRAENLFKNSYQYISQVARAYFRKGRYAPVILPGATLLC